MRIKLDDGFVIDTKSLKYVGADVDRHDNVRVYVRRHGRKARIRDWSSLEAFMAEYRALLSGSEEPAPLKHAPAAPKSLRWLFERYYGSTEFLTLEKSTRQARRRLLDALSEKHGTKPFEMMERRHVRELRDEKVRAGTPWAGDNIVKVLRSVFAWAVDAEHAEHNPAKGVPGIKIASAGWHTWTVEEVQQFEDQHPIGSKPRLAMALMLYTGVRASDAIQLGRQLERQGRLHFTEYKGRNRKPKIRSIPILPELRAVIDATPSGHLSYIVTKHAQPYSSGGTFGTWFKRQCVAAGLPHCSAHGLRKAGATIAANNGASAHVLMAIYGWTNLNQAARYTDAVDRQRLMDEHMHLVVPEQKMDESVPLAEMVQSSGTLRGKK